MSPYAPHSLRLVALTGALKTGLAGKGVAPGSGQDGRVSPRDAWRHHPQQGAAYRGWRPSISDLDSPTSQFVIYLLRVPRNEVSKVFIRRFDSTYASIKMWIGLFST